MELFQLAVAAGADCTDFDEELNEINIAKTRMLTKKAELIQEERTSEEFERRIGEINEALHEADHSISAFDEITVRQLVSNIKVISKELLLIRFKDGTEIQQVLVERTA